MAKKLTVFSGLSNARTRTFVILFGAVIVVGVGFALMRSKQGNNDILSKQGSQAISVPTEIKTTPGGAVSEQYRELLQKENERRSQEALQKKTSAIPTIIGAVSDTGPQKINLPSPDEALKTQQTSSINRTQFSQVADTNFLGATGPFTKTPEERMREQQEARIREQREQVEKARLEKERQQQQAQELERQRRLADQQQKAYQEAVAKIENQMKSYASGAYGEWNKYPNQIYVQGELASGKGAIGNLPPGAAAIAAPGAKGAVVAAAGAKSAIKLKAVKPKAFIKAGTVLFAVLDTAVNSDEPGPVMATIVSGKFQGAKILGSLIHEARQEKVTISFNQLSLPRAPRSFGVQAVAIDPDTARTALASNVNHHYLLRYGSLFAASFISGYGKAVSQSGATTTTSPLTGATTTTNPPLDNKQIFEVALGEVGTQWAQVTKKNFDVPYTVTVNQGTGIGVLFMTDVDVSESL